MPYLSVEQVRALDSLAINELGIPGETLMENAGRGVTQYIFENFPKRNFKNVVIVCGKGNNGGDGLVITRLLDQAGYHVAVVLLCSAAELQGDALLNYRKIKEKNIFVDSVQIPQADLIIDAILGTGLQGAVKDIYQETIGLMNSSGKPIIAVDIPSGINGDSGPTSDVYIKARATITFVAQKPAMSQPELFGEIRVIDIGVPL